MISSHGLSETTDQNGTLKSRFITEKVDPDIRKCKLQGRNPLGFLFKKISKIYSLKLEFSRKPILKRPFFWKMTSKI